MIDRDRETEEEEERALDFVSQNLHEQQMNYDAVEEKLISWVFRVIVLIPFFVASLGWVRELLRPLGDDYIYVNLYIMSFIAVMAQIFLVIFRMRRKLSEARYILVSNAEAARQLLSEVISTRDLSSKKSGVRYIKIHMQLKDIDRKVDRILRKKSIFFINNWHKVN